MPEPSLASPADYLAGLAEGAQIVLLGDVAGVRQHLEMLAAAVPQLAASGFDCLAWEFTTTRAQSKVDQLVLPSDSKGAAASAGFDEQLCAEVFVDLLGIGFCYDQYAEVLRAVWRHNRRTADGQPGAGATKPLRVVGISTPSYVEDPDLLSGRSAGELALRNWFMGGHHRDVDAFLSLGALTTEVLRPQLRALVYADVRHTATRSIEWHEGQPCTTMGNLLHRWMGEGVRRVVLHGALGDAAATERVEELVAASPEAQEGAELAFGLDLRSSPLGNVAVGSVVGSLDGTAAHSTGNLRLSDLADGYVYVAPRSSWQPVDLLEGVITPSNLTAAEARYRALVPRPEPYTADELEAVRTEGRDDLATQWPSLPEPEEPAPKRGLLGRRKAR